MTQRIAVIQFKGTAYSYKAFMSRKCSWAKMSFDGPVKCFK